MNFRKLYSSRSSSNLDESSCSHLNQSLNGHANGHHENSFGDHQNNGNCKIDLNSDGSFTETDSGTKSRPTSRINCMCSSFFVILFLFGPLFECALN